MAEANPWELLRKAIESPWDWVAAGVGAAGGLAASAAVLHTDMGASIGVGALGAVTARQATVASLKARTLERRAQRFMHMLADPEGPFDDAGLRRITTDVRRDRALWQNQIISDAQFEALLDGSIEQFRP